MSNASSGQGRSGAKKPTKKNARRKDALPSEGVLANLPRTRPQRSSARRDAARMAARRTTEAKASTKASTILATPGEPATTKTKPAKVATVKRGQESGQGAAKRGQGAANPRSTAKRLQDPAPRQGFETENDPLSGPVQPPGGVDLLASAVELAGELTKSGLSTGGRLLRDIFTRLPLN
jgi:hypothetical protein